MMSGSEQGVTLVQVETSPIQSNAFATKGIFGRENGKMLFKQIVFAFEDPRIEPRNLGGRKF